jgi:hypothetical protein
MIRRDKGWSDQVSMFFSGRTERRGGCMGDRRRAEESRSSMGAHERGRGGKPEGIKGGQDRLAWISVEGRRGGGGCVGDRRRDKRADHQWGLMKGGGGWGRKTRRDKGRSGQVSMYFSGRTERVGTWEDELGTEEGEKRPDHQWGLM